VEKGTISVSEIKKVRGWLSEIRAEVITLTHEAREANPRDWRLKERVEASRGTLNTLLDKLDQLLIDKRDEAKKLSRRGWHAAGLDTLEDLRDELNQLIAEKQKVTSIRRKV